MKTTTRLILVILLAALAGCGGDDNGTAPTPKTDFQVYEGAWSSLRLGDTTGAESGFRTLLNRGALVPQAFDGLGWTFLVAVDADSALANFRHAVDAGVDSTNTEDQARAGQCVSANALGEHTEAVFAGARVDENWTFTHTSTVTHDDVALTMAASHFALGDFVESLDALKMVDPAFNADMATVEGRARLAARIEALLNS
jgi:hypothetical protein